MTTRDSIFPPIALNIAAQLDISPTACLLAGGINFYYRRGPHLSPPHQIEGLARSFVPRVLNRLEIPFRRYVAKDGDDALGALAGNAMPAIVEMNDRIVWIYESDAGYLYALDAGEDRTLSHETFAAEWRHAVPVGTLYVVDWDAFQEANAPRDEILQASLLETAYDMMVCSGAWQGIDGIEFFSEDVVRWHTDEDWPASAAAAAQHIHASGSLWRHAYHTAIRTFQAVPDEQRGMLEDVTELWYDIAGLLDDAAEHEDPTRLTTVSQHLLRVVSTESRFWNHVIRQAEPGI